MIWGGYLIDLMFFSQIQTGGKHVTTLWLVYFCALTILKTFHRSAVGFVE
jgi:hypothetical protein